MTEIIEVIDKVILDIRSGKYGANEKLPSENELAYTFNVPRMTIRKAYERLQEMGMIYSRQGKGSFVKDRRNRIPLVLSGDVSFSEKMREQGYRFESVNIHCAPIIYNAKVFQFLEAKEEDKVFKVGRLRLIDEQPVALHVSYVNQSVFQDIEQDGSSISSMFEYYKRYGFSAFTSFSSTLSVTFPAQFEREVLECTSLIPLLTVESGCVDQETGTVLEYTNIFYRSDRFIYEI
ncbi:GntR family transcriptional regulator [Bacillus thermotolerans]|uniref:Transcriptional regulator of N-Acetylglucosamine utilization, GntR family n=1 Tax=Bacillus thermotolerans TaxID=1221996 RepID=A0A0F5I6B9_BACTR|nr:GntR family transcriptional regulator [Bacillus thermotolerans]KKB38051.1 putative transcriptional regulator of N-Acetylglucosamine utilization, GntR family [Bacillus thermotolerans]KKB40712.1 putative transcriptional regulator of N-Acetylglucosamine utilization, GntR family [Bacillus thermotolerans]